MRRLAVIVLLSSACSGAGSGPLPAPELRRKLLDHQRVEFPQRLFVVGLGAGSDLALATQEAFAAITRQLTWLPRGSQDLLRGMYRVERSATDADGQVQALAALEREAASAHLRRLARETERAASDRLPDCERLVQAGELEGAEACVARGTTDLGRAADLHASARAAVGDQARPTPLPAQARYSELSRQTSAGRTGRRSLLLHVLKEVDGRSDGDLDEVFASAATDSGLKRADGELGVPAATRALAGAPAALLKVARESGAGYALVGRVRARFVGEDSGQYFAMADGALRILETTGGRAVAELHCRDVKGGHISRQQALERAVREAVQQLMPALRQKLRTLAGR